MVEGAGHSSRGAGLLTTTWPGHPGFRPDCLPGTQEGGQEKPLGPAGGSCGLICGAAGLRARAQKPGLCRAGRPRCQKHRDRWRCVPTTHGHECTLGWHLPGAVFSQPLPHAEMLLCQRPREQGFASDANLVHLAPDEQHPGPASPGERQGGRGKARGTGPQPAHVLTTDVFRRGPSPPCRLPAPHWATPSLLLLLRAPWG